jgi:hypothetical protein
MKRKPIRIKPENRGKLTAQAKRAGMSVREFAKKAVSPKSRATAATKKRAVFALNAAKWKK